MNSLSDRLAVMILMLCSAAATGVVVWYVVHFLKLVYACYFA
jgi:hypothetical protein